MVPIPHGSEQWLRRARQYQPGPRPGGRRRAAARGDLSRVCESV